MDRSTRSGLKAGIIGVAIIAIAMLILFFGWLYAREHFMWFIFLFFPLLAVAFIVAGLASGIFEARHMKDMKDPIRSGLISGLLTAIIPGFLFMLVIVLALYAGREQLGWVFAGFEMIFVILAMIAIAAACAVASSYLVKKSRQANKF